MRGAVLTLRKRGAQAPACVGVHAVFATGAMDRLRDAAPSRIVTTNTIAHETNAIDIGEDLAAAVTVFLTGRK